MVRYNIVYMLNGSIGDFLMVLVLFEEIHKQDKEGKYKLIINTPRNKEAFTSLASQYDFISITDRRFSTLVSLFLKKNIVITPPTPGNIPFKIKAIARILSFRGKCFGFDDGHFINRLVYTNVLPFNPHILFIELLYKLLPLLGLQEIAPETSLEFTPTPVHQKKPYIVVHPFGSSRGRSIEGGKLQQLIEAVHEKFPQHLILISGSSADAKRVPSMENGSVENIAGKYSLLEMVGVLKKADVYIGVDTGITHLASVLNKKALVIAEQGTSHWLPYYNENAVIIYKVRGDESGVYSGREYLESKREKDVRYTDRVPLSVIKKYVNEIK